jgi:dolichyl-phosphate beta-glucosyltransferase
VAAAADADVVVGSRRLPTSSFTAPQPWARRFGGGVFIQLVNVLGLRTTSDPQCGVKVLRRGACADVVAATTSPGFAFDIELLTRARRAGLRVVELPVRWHHAEGSSIRPVRDGAATVGDLLGLRRLLRSTP